MQFLEFTWLAIHFTRLSRGDQRTQALFNSAPGKTPRNFRVLDVFSIPAAVSPWTFYISHLCEWQLSGLKVTLFHIEENQCDQSFVNSVCPFRVNSWPISAAHWWPDAIWNKEQIQVFLLVSDWYSHSYGLANCQISLSVGSIWHHKFINLWTHKILSLDKLSIMWRKKLCWQIVLRCEVPGRLSSMRLLSVCLFFLFWNFSPLHIPVYDSLLGLLRGPSHLFSSPFRFPACFSTSTFPPSSPHPSTSPSHFTSPPSLQRLIHLVLRLPRSSRLFYPGTWAAAPSNLATR